MSTNYRAFFKHRQFQLKIFRARIHTPLLHEQRKIFRFIREAFPGIKYTGARIHTLFIPRKAMRVGFFHFFPRRIAEMQFKCLYNALKSNVQNSISTIEGISDKYTSASERKRVRPTAVKRKSSARRERSGKFRNNN